VKDEVHKVYYAEERLRPRVKVMSRESAASQHHVMAIRVFRRSSIPRLERPW